jgi:sporulation integral membrane protein YlbJ
MMIIFLILGIFLVIAIAHPAITLAGAACGLQIWFFQLLPSLLPFMICTNLFLSAPVKNFLAGEISRIRCLQGHRIHYGLVLLCGYTFGLPMGAKITADLVRHGSLGKKEGQLLLNHCNVAGPAFISGFVLTQCLLKPEKLPITLLLIYGPQWLSLLLRLPKTNAVAKHPLRQPTIRKETPRLKNFFQILDVAIMNGFETITILGGYLILFGILCAMVRQISFLPDIAKLLFLGMCEMTTGVNETAGSSLSSDAKYLLCAFFCSFGGICTLLQTATLIQGTTLSCKSYLLHKLCFGVLTLLLTAVYLGLY